MTYHMERVCMYRPRGRGVKQDCTPNGPWMGDFSRKIRFPQKLFDVINNGSKLIVWNAEGNGIIVNEEDFEDSIMTEHPGLVQISTFANFRRQLRWYGFEWEAIDRSGNFQFTHTSFLRDCPDILDTITTKKKFVSDVDSYTHLQHGMVTRCSGDAMNKHMSQPKSHHPVTERGKYKPRGRRGRPRKRRSGETTDYSTTPSLPSGSSLPDSDCDLTLDEAELDKVVATLSETRDEMEFTTGTQDSQEFPSSTKYSAPSTSHIHNLRNQSSRGRCWRNNSDRGHCCRCCCHCCCHCCCCEPREDWWQYCKPWMQHENNTQYKYDEALSQDDSFHQQSQPFGYPNLSYYSEVPQYPVSNNNLDHKPISPMASPQAHVITPVQLGTSGRDTRLQGDEPVEYGLYGQPQLYQADSSITSAKDIESQDECEEKSSLATL